MNLLLHALICGLVFTIVLIFVMLKSGVDRGESISDKDRQQEEDEKK